MIGDRGGAEDEMTGLIERIPVNSISPIFFAIGFLYYLYMVAFRWPVIRSRYGTISLYWWPPAVLFAFSMAGWFLALAIWLIQRQLSN